jgi:ubiquitin-activating enzyme E1
MVQANEEVKIDTDLYSRQIGTFGIETMGKLIKMKVAIIGARGLGVETAKNLILAGPAQVDLYDPTIVRIEDLGANFYLTEAHVGKVSRAEAISGQLKELNPYVKVNVLDSFDEKVGLDYNVVVITEYLFNGA